MRSPMPTPRKPAPDGDDDATVKMPSPSRRRRPLWPWFLGGTAVVAALVAVLLRPGLTPIRPPPPPAVQTPAVPAAPAPATLPVPAPIPAPLPSPAPAVQTPPVPVAPAPAPVTPVPVIVPPPSPALTPAIPAAPALPSADEAALLADPAEHLTMLRFASEPLVVVLDFPTLEMQGRTLNRVAALTEKAKLPRDRVLTDAELDAAIRASGDTAATYYYGHDYAAATLVRFFALADRDRIALNAEEEHLRALLQQFGWTGPDPRGALISLSRQGADPDITPSVRAAILHHEISHGAFFVEPVFAEFVRQFWRTEVTAAERDKVRHFLGSEDYDSSDEDLMANEMQAYLMFTDDPHFFRPADFGMTEARREELRVAFRRDVPIDWLRAAIAPPRVQPVAAAPAAATPVAAAPMAAAAAPVATAPATVSTAVSSQRRSISVPSEPRPPAATPR